MSVDLKSPVADLVGGARGRLLETIARVGRPFSIRQLAEMSDITHPQASELLQQFENMGLVRSQRVGRSVAYEPVGDNVLLQAIRRILSLRQEIIDSLETYAEDAPPGVTLALFGSVVSGRATQGSDLDVLVITEDGERPEDKDWVEGFLAFAQKASGLDVNPLRYTMSAWKQANSQGELITKTIADIHLVLAGKL